MQASGNLSAAPGIHSAMDPATDGRRCFGWVCDLSRPGFRLTVLFTVDRPLSPQADFTAEASIDRPDLRTTPYAGSAFSAPIPQKWRDGRRHAFHAGVLDASGKLVPLNGSPRTVQTAPVIQIPKPFPNPPRVPVADDAQIWLGAECPFAQPYGESFDFLAKPDADRLLRRVQGLYYPVGTLRQATLEQMQVAKRQMDRFRLPLIIELAGLSQWMAPRGKTFGRDSAEQEMDWIRKWWSAPSDGGLGGEVHYLDLDDPLYRGLYPDDKLTSITLDEVIDQLSQAIRVWQSRFPRIRSVLISNFPNWGWKGGPAYFDMKPMKGSTGRGDYYPVLLRTIERLKALGTPLYGLMMDCPYDYTLKLAPTNQPDAVRRIDFIKRLRDVEQIARAHGLKYGIFFNTDLQDYEPEGVLTPDQRDRIYFQHTLNFIDHYRKAGGTPDIYNTFTWMKAPTRFGPLDRPYTQMWNVNTFIDRLRGA